MKKYSLILLVGVIVHMGSSVYGQKESENTNACIFIPNNISVRCDHYNKDFTLDVLITAPCVVKNMKVLDRWEAYCIQQIKGHGHGTADYNLRVFTM